MFAMFSRLPLRDIDMPLSLLATFFGVDEFASPFCCSGGTTTGEFIFAPPDKPPAYPLLKTSGDFGLPPRPGDSGLSGISKLSFLVSRGGLSLFNEKGIPLRH